MSRIAFIIGFVMLPALASAQSAEDRKFTAAVDGLVHRVMALNPAPGVAVAVVKDIQDGKAVAIVCAGRKFMRTQ